MKASAIVTGGSGGLGVAVVEELLAAGWRVVVPGTREKELARLEQMDWKHLLTATAYQMRLILQDIYRAPSLAQARKDFVAWCNWVKTTAAKEGHELLQPMVGAAEMVERHLKGILAHWKQGLTTAFMEGLNSLFSATKRKARGYRTTKNLLTMLYFVAGKLQVPCY